MEDAVLTDKTTGAISALESMWAKVAESREKAGFHLTDAPECAFTVAKYMERFHIQSDQVARKELARMVESGEYRRGYKWDATRGGRLCRLVCYWPVEVPCQLSTQSMSGRNSNHKKGRTGG